MFVDLVAKFTASVRLQRLRVIPCASSETKKGRRLARRRNLDKPCERKRLASQEQWTCW